VKRVIFAPDALADLEGIGTYIATDNPARAVSFIADLQEAARHIADAPEAYRARDDIARGLRMAVKGRYLILFRVKQDRVEIARVLHGARDLHRIAKE
jgi:toxin ParE1/3/4